tara:strand:- start:543 stop:668 length:126 start_codon:yes stop_codon:yes gene_type:complete
MDTFGKFVQAFLGTQIKKNINQTTKRLISDIKKIRKMVSPE